MSPAQRAARGDLATWLEAVGASERERRAAWFVFDSYVDHRSRPGWSTVLSYCRTDLKVGRDIATRREVLS